MRILITGSRTWTDTATIRAALAEVWTPGNVLVSGAARGADALCAACWRHWGGDVEEYPADWRGPCAASCPPGHRRTRTGGWSYCPNAGHVRNLAMIQTGPDLCLAFIRDRSRGATHCAGWAELAGIPTRIFAA
jgi:hypothetical protein